MAIRSRKAHIRIGNLTVANRVDELKEAISMKRNRNLIGHWPKTPGIVARNNQWGRMRPFPKQVFLLSEAFTDTFELYCACDISRVVDKWKKGHYGCLLNVKQAQRGMMEGASPCADYEGEIEVPDFAAFQTSSPAPRSPSVSHQSPQRHSFDGAEHGRLSGFSYSSPPPVDVHPDGDAEAPYASSEPPSDEDGEDFLHDHPADDSSSSRSSISSLPASIMPDSSEDTITFTSLKQSLTRDNFEQRFRNSPFRHPSSVRDMQMNDELTPPSKRRAISAMTDITNASPASTASPSKIGICSPQGSPIKPKFKKVNPLILLHCKLLPPSLVLPAGLDTSNEKLLKDLLPEEYFKRWKLLKDAIGGTSSTIKERGVLIPHPKEDYDLLEERVLESLELLEPRIHDGHFLGCQQFDDEEYDEGSDTLNGNGERCPDCGRPHPTKNDRKWEVKVYAATGLMREGAWDAAWKEMEKVDVEIGVFIPEVVRLEIEEKVEEKASASAFDVMEDSYVAFETDEQRQRRREIYGGLHTEPSPKTTRMHVPISEADEVVPEPPNDNTDGKVEEETPLEETKREVEPDFQRLILNYLALLAKDPRNVAILLLGILSLYLVWSRASVMAPPPGVVQATPSQELKTTECRAPSASTTAQVSTSIMTEYVTMTATPKPEVELNEDGIVEGFELFTQGEEMFET